MNSQLLDLLEDTRLFRQQAYLNGEWVDGEDTIAVKNPATNQVIGYIPSLGEFETRQAIEKADIAGKKWRSLSAKERGNILRKWYDLMMENVKDLATIMTFEQGKPLTEACGEIAYAASFLEWFAEEAKRVYGDIIPATKADQRIFVTKEPIGVCAAITPWNFPSAMITRKAGPALAAGCSMIVRPAELTPFSALALAELADRAGVPAGVFQVITGKSRVIGKEFTSNPLVKKLTFTGSTEVGRELIAQCASTVKKVSMELGGNAPFIVFDDADLDKAVEGAMASKYRNAGQTCVCANRLYVQSGIYDAFAKKLAEAVNALTVGNGITDGVNVGPMINQSSIEKIVQHIDDAIAKGASVVTGGKVHKLGGTFFEPTVLTNVTQSMKVAKEETFGPLAPLFKFDTEEEVIQYANDTEFGLASYFFTQDLGRVVRVCESLEYGMIGVNTGLISNEVAPFGGVKQSGLGREGSKYGIEDYIVIKYTCLSGF